MSILVRHLSDIEDLSKADRDSSIDPREEKYVLKMSEYIGKILKEERRPPLIFYSPRRRVTQTLELVMEQVRLSEDSSRVVPSIWDPRLIGLHRGKYNLPATYKPGDVFVPNDIAWDVWVKETFTYKNLLYRYGDPLFSNNKPKYPELVGQFQELGENHVEFSLRIYSFLIEFLKSESSERYFSIIFSHLAVTSRMAEILAVFETLEDRPLKKGTLPFEEWNHMKKIKPTLKALSSPIYTTELDLNALKKYLPIIESEQDHLLELLMQSLEK